MTSQSNDNGAIPPGAAQALGRAMHAQRLNSSKQSQNKANETNSSNVSIIQTVWQHPYVDVFKHFKVLPVSDWKANKKQGEVNEAFAREIGRKVMSINGSISANNFIQLPHPNSMTRTLGLTGRYLYLQAKAPISSAPFSFHIDLNLCDRSHGIRISASNLYKQVSTQNGFVLQLPLNLDVDRWTVIVFDIISLLKMSRLLPQSYIIEGSYQIKGLTLCANSVIRGVYTSDNEYDFVTLPPDMRFKFSFDINRWPEYFAWLELPKDLRPGASESQLAQDRFQQLTAKAALQAQNKGGHMTEEQKTQMQMEIDALLTHQRLTTTGRGNQIQEVDKKAKYDAMQAEMQAMLGPKDGHGGDDLLTPDEMLGFGAGGPGTQISDQRIENTSGRALNLRGLPSAHSNASNQPYQAGMYIGEQRQINPKLNKDPIMELQHIIGYSPDKCLSLKWSRIANEQIVLFTSCGSLIAMDVETNEQKRFFFGHSAPICCFDVAQSGNLIASAQEGKNSIIRIWDYHNARCLQMLTMPVINLQCVSFSPDGRFLACVGKEAATKRQGKGMDGMDRERAAKRTGKEMIIVWDISRIHKGEKAEILAKQVSEFNIISLKFSPIDNYKLISCGKQNIRFWRIKETRNIRGSAVVLNQYARDTVFTCLDFELSGMRSGPESVVHDGTQSGKKKDGLRRVYVASKTGMVYQINYDDETLEATYRTNDSAIYSIAINQAFCVTGSEDQYLRIWALDFNEFLMEAKHEGTVCSVDISADGLKVACGTLNGSLGVLNKSNQRYQTLLRSHTASIISMDFHLAKRNVITVSHDDTIRLWDLVTFDQVVEFSSPIDQPLCVAAHPTLPIFSCGFQSGTMRVFDIEKTCVCDNFTQFNKPIRAIAYSPNGDLLVTCCEDGSVALHNARRQHLPTKMLNLEFAPEFVHVAFSTPIARQQQNVFNRNVQLRDLNGMNGGSGTESISQMSGVGHENQSEELSVMEEVTILESLFGIMGEYGNNLMIYSSDSIILKHQINVGSVIRSFQFTKNNREVIIVTKDQRIRVYSLATFEGAYLRELHTVHKGAVTCTDLSLNGGYMLTGGQDNLLKLWDYDAQKTVPHFFQAFIGHTYPLVNAMFNPLDNGMVISAAENDGIYVWKFDGDVHTNYHPQIEQQDEQAPTAQIDRDHLHEPTVLERMRASVKEKRKPKLAEFSFIMPEFKVQETVDPRLSSLGVTQEQVDTTGIKQYYEAQVQERELSFNQFVSVKDLTNVDIQVEKGPVYATDGQGKVIEPVTVNGYDGFGGVHDNLLWTPSTGMITYTLHNKIIIENTRTRQQTVLTESEVRLSTLARTQNERILAAAEGEPSRYENAVIFLIDATQNKLLNKISFFRHGVQTMAFSNCGRFLIACSVPEERSLMVLDVNSGLVCEGGTAILPEGESVNKIVVNPNVDTDVDFITVGQKGNFILWRYDYETQAIYKKAPELSQDLANTDFTCATYTPRLPAPHNAELIILGTADGAVCAVDASNIDRMKWLEHGKKEFILGEAISSIIYRHSAVVISGSQGNCIKYSDKHAQVLPPDDRDMITRIKTDEPISATCMDDQNNEGIIGTADGSIKYIQFNDESHSVVKLVGKVSPYLDQISILRYDQHNPNVFLTNCGKSSGDMQLLTSGMLDHIYTFPQYSLGPVRFVAASPKDKKNRMIGHENGFIKTVSINSLKVNNIYKVSLEEGEALTCGVYTPSGHNFAIGTSFGSIFIGMLKKDPMANNTRYNMFLARVDRVSHGSETAVTSLQLTSFNPQGCILAAFDNGQVRCWHSSVKHEVYVKLQEMKQNNRKSKKKEVYDLAELGETQFDVVDKFDMFENPHGVEELTENDVNDLAELYGGKRYPDCEAMFNNAGSSGVDHYFCYVSALQYIFVRNYNMNETVKKISLLHFPTKLGIMEYNRLANEAGLTQLSRIGIASLVAVGTKEGKVLIYRLDMNEAKLLLRTKSGVLYGGVTALSMQDGGNSFVVASSTGEVMTFQLLQNLIGLESE